MAALGNIRKRSGLLLAVIGIAMLAFILGDFMQSKRSGGGGSVIVGEVSGESILINVFEEKVQEGIENWKNQNPQTVLTATLTGQLRAQIWTQYIKELIMSQEYEKLGLDVSDDEFFELLQGVNVHPEISKITAFQNESTGQFDRSKVLNYLQQIDSDPTGEARSRWIGFQKYLVDLIKTSKYNSLISNAMYITTEEAKLISQENNNKIIFNYLKIPFSTIDDSLVEPSNKEIKDYYKSNKKDYQQEASKDVDYVVFEVAASDEDDLSTLDAIKDLIVDFKSYDDYELIARRNSDNTSAKFIFSKKEDLQDPKWGELFDKKEGEVIGPYLFSDGVYRIAKLVASENRADSVEARHILLTPNETMDLDSAERKINSFKDKIEQGADFGNIALKESDDKSSAIKGGDLGWFQEGTMVDEFNELCFTSAKGDLNIVKTQFGVHLVQLTNSSRKKKKIKVAFIDRYVEPSSETFNVYYSQAAEFAGKILNTGISFDSLLNDDNLVKRSDVKVQVNKQNISGLPNSREMVKWLNNAEIGQISEVFQFDNAYVVAHVTNVYEEGFTPLEEIKEQIKSLVVRDKKFTKISEMINKEKLEDIALANNISVVEDQKISFVDQNIPGIGFEPELVGLLFGDIDIGMLSEPIKGRDGLYLFTISNKENVQEIKEAEILNVKTNKKNEMRNFSNQSAYNALEKEADIKDNRTDFY